MSDVEASRAKEGRRRRAEVRASLEADRNRRGRNAPWRRAGRVVRREAGNVVIRLALPATLRALSSSWRVERIDVEHYETARAGRGFLAALWHGNMLPLLPVHRRAGIGVLVSPSRDGELVAMTLRRFGYRVIRGSSNRSGARAMREMRDELAGGGSVVITPDGPRGPRHGMNLGIAWLASQTGLPVLTVGVACAPAWHMRSWDRFVVPKWGARVALVYGELLRVPAEASEELLEAKTEEIRARLQACEGRARARLTAAAP